MSDSITLIELIDGAKKTFVPEGPFCREDLEAVLGSLLLVLADSDEFEFAVIEKLWPAVKSLQSGLDDESGLDEQVFAGIFAQLVVVADLLRNVDADSEALETQEPQAEAFIIPEEDVSMIEEFIVETVEHLESAEAALLELETNPEDSDVLNLIFRAFHTIKGMAGFMNLEQIGSLSHVSESLLDKARKGDLLLEGTPADAIFQAIDLLKTMVDALRAAIERDCVLMPQAGLDDMLDFIRMASSDEPQEISNEPLDIEEPKSSVGSDEPAIIELISPIDPVEVVVAPVEKTPAEKKHTNQPAKVTSHIDEKIKVSTSRLDNLVNLVGELVIAQLMVGESLKTSASGNEDLLRNAAHQGKIIRELQELSMSMRMVPISGLFQKMARMIRDLSRTAGKEIRYSTQGEQTELDRTIVDKIADPLVHMIRNSVDHGIENTEERAASGKGPTGRVELRAFHLGGNIVVEIEDDGRGICPKKLLEKAISKGLVAADRNLSEQEIFNLIFHPGFSTAEKVTKISGRGVGMDVVKRNIEDLRGRVDIASKLGEGTTFTITLPLTLAVIDGQVIQIGTEKFIVPINSIRRTFRPEESQISTVYGKGEVVKVHDELFPLVRLDRLFSIKSDSSDVSDGLLMIVEEDNQACCLFIDSLLDQQQVVIKSLGEMLSIINGISGGAIMGDGTVRLILDIPGIMKLFRN